MPVTSASGPLPLDYSTFTAYCQYILQYVEKYDVQCGEGGVVHCYCHHHQLLKLGLHGRVREASQPPADTRALHVENCRHVELFGGLLNHMQHLQVEGLL